MIILVALFVYTFVIVFLQRKIWKLMPNIVFPVFTFILYYWTLAGSWLFTLDQLSGQSGKKIGLNYYYLLEKMFPVKLDNDYLLSISMYGVFIILFQAAVWAGLKYYFRKPVIQPVFVPRTISSNYIALFALGLCLVSFLIVKDLVFYTLILNESVYINVRTTAIPHYTLHQYANWTLIVSLFLYLGLYYRRDQIFLNVTKPGILFWFAFIVCNLYLIMIGTRHEVFFAGILACIVFVYPSRTWKNYYKTLIPFGAMWLLILALNDPVRSLMPVISEKAGLTAAVSSADNIRRANLFAKDRTFITHRSEAVSERLIREKIPGDTMVVVGADTVVVSKKILVERDENADLWINQEGVSVKIPSTHVSKAYQTQSVAKNIFSTFSSLVFSNELFSGHFSMYGIISENVPPKPGISFKNLLYSFIPSFIVRDRPEDSYEYYAKKMKFPDGQGFTINHISAWYLNFGYFGLLLGPVVLAFILMLPLYILQYSDKINRRFAAWIALCGATAFGAMLTRSGPEVYKALLYEAILIPLIILFSGICWQKIRDKFFQRNDRKA